ncbi:MAG: polyprenyl diphosphate synthase, partial [Candidatus Pacebacteria bacterium]|nr:polyprenyl diphosphate synthase [Candidatus Paceibacterota bacterium]
MKIPNHIGVILDGNRRWAEENGLLATQGHIEGVKRAKELVRYGKQNGVKNLTLFVFSTENWKRSEKEVGFLMRLIEVFFDQEMKEYSLLNNVKVLIVGEREKLSQRIRSVVDAIEEKTKNNSLMTLNIALSYGGRGEIVSAIKKIMKKGISID